jgi:serine/threonine-protein kinase
VEGDARWLDRFELVAELATGGMATVFLGRISGAGGFQRFVGIKRLHPHLAREPEFTAMFLEEARLAARIHHPNVVPILEIGTSDQGYYIVMEYVEGATFANLIARTVQSGRRMPVRIAARILIDVLQGLHAAHELADDDGKPLGIVHRDVSPQNILIGIDGSARLTDFGVARATSKLSTTRTGQLKGKLAYMAPEQARSAKDIDRRADIFAAGVVFWEALEGRRLFKGDGEADTLNKVLNEPIPALRNAEPSLPREIEEVLQGALERERARRFATAALFAENLERVTHEVDEVATHKDVAAYLEEILGPEIQKQRETVRALIASREPNRPKSLSMPPPAPVPPLSRRRVSPESTPSSSRGGPSLVSSPTLPPSLVSMPSVESPPPVQRGRARVWVLLVAVALLGALGLIRWSSTREPERASASKGQAASAPAAGSPSSPPPLPSAPSAPSVTAPALAVSTPSATAVEPTGSEAPTGNVGARPHGTGSAPGSKPSAQPSAPAGGPAAPVPDDISRNPYR